MYSFVIRLFCLLLISGCGGGNVRDSDSITDSEEEAFGFGKIQVDGQLAEGTRPVSVMLENDSCFAPSSHDASYFDNLFFGSGDKTLVGYFSEMSNGIFTWSRAGVIGPINYMMPADIIADLEVLGVEDFGIRTVGLMTDGTDFYPMDVQWWRCSEITARVSLGVPAGRLSPGLHQVRFEGTDGVSPISININIIIDAVVVGINTPPSAQITSHSDSASV